MIRPLIFSYFAELGLKTRPSYCIVIHIEHNKDKEVGVIEYLILTLVFKYVYFVDSNSFFLYTNIKGQFYNPANFVFGTFLVGYSIFCFQFTNSGWKRPPLGQISP